MQFTEREIARCVLFWACVVRQTPPRTVQGLVARGLAWRALAGWQAEGVAVQGSINIAFHPFSKLEICCAGAKGCSDVM